MVRVFILSCFFLFLFIFSSGLVAQKFDIGISMSYGFTINEFSDVFTFKLDENPSSHILWELDPGVQLDYNLLRNDKTYIYSGIGPKFFITDKDINAPVLANLYVGIKHVFNVGNISLLGGGEVIESFNFSGNKNFKSNYLSYKIFFGFGLGIFSEKIDGLMMGYGFHKFSDLKFSCVQISIPIYIFD